MGSGPPLVFIHGLAGCWQNWLENIPHFARRHRVIAVDLPGFGESELPHEDISIPGYGRFVDAFLGEIGVERAALVGNSMGGFIAAETAISHPEPGRASWCWCRPPGCVTVPERRSSALVEARRSAVPPTRRRARSRAASTGCAGRALRRMLPVRGRDATPTCCSPSSCYEVASGAGKPGFLDALQRDLRLRLPRPAARRVATRR